MVSVVKRLTSALLTKEDVLALNTFFLHELLKITQRPGCTLFRSLPRGASTRCTTLDTGGAHRVLSGFPILLIHFLISLEI